MKEGAKKSIIENFQNLFSKYGSGPDAIQRSLAGQLFRFEKLALIADLKGMRVLHLRCISDYL